MSTCRISTVILLGATATFIGGSGYAQVSGSTPNTTGVANSATPSDGLIEYLRRTFQFTGSARVRVEAPQGSDFTSTPADAYALTRIRFGLAFRPLKWLRFFGEAEDSRVEFYRTNPPSTLSDPFEWRQGYVEAGAIEGDGAKLRVGRQDLFIGSLHLISTGDWSNITKNFNVARGTLTEGNFKLDMIGGSVVLDDPTRMDRSKPGEHFYVAYGAWKNLLPGASIEPYVMAKTAMNVKGKDGKLGDADTIYGGLRLIGKVGAFDYNAEAVREGGSYGTDVVQALGYVAGAGWLIRDTLAKPHVSSDFSWASGDSGRKDGHHESFDYLYGAQQPLMSLAGQVAWRNIGDWRAGVDFAPFKKLTVKVDFRDYWLATVQDGLYNAFGTRTVLNAKATSTHVGEGIESQFVYTITPKTSFGIGVGNLTPGAYLKQSGKTTGYVYPYLSFSRSL
jgi:hypothetical protein